MTKRRRKESKSPGLMRRPATPTHARRRAAGEVPRAPRSRRLPGLENHGIEELEGLAESYADLRDQRMELTNQEHAAKGEILKAMRRHNKTAYSHAGIAITVIAGEDDVKVRVRKGGEDETETGAERIGDTETEGEEEARARRGLTAAGVAG